MEHRLFPIIVFSLLAVALTASPQAERHGLRLIVVEGESEAADLRAQIQAGTLFEQLARNRSVDPSAAAGGYLGTVVVGDLRQEFQDALAGLGPGEISPVARIGDDYFLLQLLTEIEDNWIALSNAGRQAFQESRYQEAEQFFSQAVQEADNLASEDQRLAQSLDNLAEVHRLQGNYAEAEPLIQQSLAIWEEVFGPNHLDVATSLNNLATLYQDQGDYTEAEPLYQRSLGILEGVLGPEHPDVVATLNNLALLYQVEGKYAEAEPLYQRSLAVLERVLGPEHPDVVATLNNLATLHQDRGNYTEAELLYQRSLAILERLLGPEHPDLAEGLLNLAVVYQAQDNYAEAEPLFRRSLSMRWSIPAGEERPDVSEVLENLSAVLNSAYVRDEQFEKALEDYDRSITGTPLLQELYLAMSEIFAAADMPAEAEMLMSRTVESFPESGMAHYRLGELYAESERIEKALEEWEKASQLQGPVAPDLIHKKIGDAYARFIQFDAALSAYENALSINPSNVGARLALADLHLGGNRLEEALAEYNRVISGEPDNVEAHHKIAEVNLGMGRFTDAVRAAETALEIDPQRLKSRYLRATALIRLGQREEGQEELQEYRKLEEDARTESDRQGDAWLSNWNAVNKLAAGENDEAIEVFLKGIESHPGSRRLYLNLGLAQSSLGRHEAALETFQTMVDLGVSDDFLVHKNLAREYDVIGNIEASRREQLIYLQRIEAELKLRLLQLAFAVECFTCNVVLQDISQRTTGIWR